MQGVRGHGMNCFRKGFMRLFPRVYIRRSIARIERKFRERRLEAIKLPQVERWNLEAEFRHELDEWLQWQRCIEDRVLINRAKKMDILLDDIPTPDVQFDLKDEGHYRLNDYGQDILRYEVRDALINKVRERKHSYDKEQREKNEFYVKITTGIISALTGLIGATIGLFTVLNKH
jgi:hypothetical protein